MKKHFRVKVERRWKNNGLVSLFFHRWIFPGGFYLKFTWWNPPTVSEETTLSETISGDFFFTDYRTSSLKSIYFRFWKSTTKIHRFRRFLFPRFLLCGTFLVDTPRNFSFFSRNSHYSQNIFFYLKKYYIMLTHAQEYYVLKKSSLFPYLCGNVWSRPRTSTCRKELKTLQLGRDLGYRSW